MTKPITPTKAPKPNFDSTALEKVYSRRVRLPVYHESRVVTEGIYGRAPSGRPGR